jgi:translation initiation factor IF-1
MVEPDIQGDTVQRAREEVATPAEIMDMIQEDMFDVQLMNGLMTQRMNRMIQLLERLKLEQPRQA